MIQPKYTDSITFVHPHGLYLAGAELALPGLRLIVDRPGLNSTIAMLQDTDVKKELLPGSRLLLMKPAPKIEFLAKAQGWQVVAGSSELNRRFESKLGIRAEFAKAGVPTLPCVITRGVDAVWEDLVRQYGTRLVVQTDRGHAGSSSLVVESEEDWNELVKEEGEYEMKIMPFLEGETWTLNACVTRYGTLVSRPFLQLQNIPGCGVDNPLTTCGNWHKSCEETLVDEIVKHAKAFGEHLKQAGYLGWFGLDVLVKDGVVVGFIECNPRLTASVGIFTRLQVEEKQIPMLVLHVLELLGIDYELDLKKEQEQLLRGFHEYHVVLRNGTGSDMICPERSGEEGVLVVTRKPGTVVPPGEPYALRVAQQPF